MPFPDEKTQKNISDEGIGPSLAHVPFSTPNLKMRHVHPCSKNPGYAYDMFKTD